MNAASAHRQEFCVRWNSHLGSIGAAFPQLLAGQRFVDVTLACEGHQVHCHRLVLAACSSYFESILSENPCKHPVIILPSEIKLWEIQALVDFMYKGEVNVTQAGLPQLLRCAEQLRIRGLYGSDAALNLNQLKALSQKVTTNHSNAALSDGGNVVGLPNQAADSVDEDDTATSSTITSQINHLQQQQQQQQQQQLPLAVGNTPTIVPEQFIKKEPISSSSQQSTAANMTSSGINHKITQQQLQQQQQQQQQQQSRQILNSVGLAAMIAATTTTTSASNAPSADDDDDSGDDSNSNAYENYEATPQINANKSQLSHHSQQKQKQELQQQHAMDANIDEDHNYVAHEEDDSFGGLGGLSINEHDSSIVQSSMEGPNGSKRVRRSEASLAQAAKLVSKGQTFQTVSNIFNIPVSTIRFYMARKGILPKRKRGRGASSNLGVGMNITAGSAVTAANVATVMTHALAQIKGTTNSDNAVAAVAAALPHPDMPFNNMNYKLEQGAAHMI